MRRNREEKRKIREEMEEWDNDAAIGKMWEDKKFKIKQRYKKKRTIGLLRYLKEKGKEEE